MVRLILPILKEVLRMRRHARLGAALALALLATTLPLAAQDLASFEKRVTTHKLANGWTFLIVQRPGVPVFAFCTIADVGSAQEVPGITGLAHMFEHMAFKGSPHLGTSDWPAEEKALAASEAAYQAWQTERLSPRPDKAKLERLRADFEARQKEASVFADGDEFSRLLENEGVSGLNASTGADETLFYYSLPSNKLELWTFAESERFLHPVFREFYQERNVVHEERRMALEGSPQGMLLDQLQVAAFQDHPYHYTGIGFTSDLDSLTATDAEAFFKTYYAPSRMTTTLVGDLDPAAVIPLLEKYFGRIPARPAPPPLRTVEHPQEGERTIVLASAAQPIYSEAYHKPAVTDPDTAVWVAIDDILATGRTSRLYRTLVRDRKLATRIDSLADFPGEKYPNLWGVLVTPALGVRNDQVRDALHGELDRLSREDVTDQELARAKNRARATLLRSLRSNFGLAINLSERQRLFGDWRELFRSLDRLDQVTKADIRRVAGGAFHDTNRTVVMISDHRSDDRPQTRPEASK
jgi:predicted Zn-dependent peptidase